MGRRQLTCCISRWVVSTSATGAMANTSRLFLASLRQVPLATSVSIGARVGLVDGCLVGSGRGSRSTPTVRPQGWRDGDNDPRPPPRSALLWASCGSGWPPTARPPPPSPKASAACWWPRVPRPMAHPDSPDSLAPLSGAGRPVPVPGEWTRRHLVAVMSTSASPPGTRGSRSSTDCAPAPGAARGERQLAVQGRPRHRLGELALPAAGALAHGPATVGLRQRGRLRRGGPPPGPAWRGAG